MALYFKCPECGNYFIDYIGENAADDSRETYLYGPYLCPECNHPAESIESEEFYKHENKKND